MKQQLARHPVRDLGHFPGYQAGASLKPDVLGADEDGHRDFPGYQAGASLKPAANSPENPAAPKKLPRLPSRGLIEAVRAGERLSPA